MVRLQGDFAKAPEKRFNYKHCFDALFRVSCVFFGFVFWFFSFCCLGLSFFFHMILCTVDRGRYMRVFFAPLRVGPGRVGTGL